MTSYNTIQTEPSSSHTLEMQPMPKSESNKMSSEQMKENQKNFDTADPEDIRDNTSPPETAIEAKQQWNSPRINMWRVFACYFSFLIGGMNDGSYGPLLLRFEDYYHLNYTVVSLVFLSPFARLLFSWSHYCAADLFVDVLPRRIAVVYFVLHYGESEYSMRRFQLLIMNRLAVRQLSF